MDDFTSKNFALPENMFYFHNNDLHPLTFVLDWDTENGFYKSLLNRFFADVCEELNEYSLVLAKPKKTKYFHRRIPAFDIKYIEDCFRLKDCPDPNLYLIPNSCPVTYKTSDIYDCWYHRKKSWSDLVGTCSSSNSYLLQEKTVVRETNSDDGDSSNDNIKILANRRKLMSCEKVISRNQKENADNHYGGNNDNTDVAKRRKKNSYEIISNTSSDDDNIMLNTSVQLETAPNKRTRLPYSMREEKEIVKYIVRNKHAFDVFGKDMWQKMESANVCKIRTWQSMKQRYIKHIRWDLMSRSHKFEFLSDEELKMLRQGLKIDAIKSDDKKKLKSKLLEERIDEYDSDYSS